MNSNSFDCVLCVFMFFQSKKQIYFCTKFNHQLMNVKQDPMHSYSKMKIELFHS